MANNYKGGSSRYLELLDREYSQKPTEETSQWQAQLDDTVNKILNREKFSYDVNADALYQQYKDQYVAQGKMAMMDTMGQAANLTGGYGSSYAQQVGQQAYQGYLQGLNDVVPELYQLALDQYNQEGQDLRNQHALLGDMVDRDHDLYLEKLVNWQSDRDYYTGRYDAERSNEQWQAQFDEAKRQYDQDYASKITPTTGNLTDGYYDDSKPLDYDPHDTEPVIKPITGVPEPDGSVFSGFDAGDWEGYFAAIRQSEGKAAAEAELKELTSKGLIPKNMVNYAAIGARGGQMGH